MSKSKIVSLILVIVLCGTAIYSVTAIAPTSSGDEFWLDSIIENAYNYPVLPERDTELWAKLETNEERAAVLQIPDELLASMSTEGLLATCLQYPNIVPLFAYNSPIRGVERMMDEFNGFQELLSRDDVGAVVVELCSKMDVNSLLKTDSYPVHRMMLLEYIVAHPSVLASVSDQEPLLNALYDMAVLTQDKCAFDGQP